MASIRIGGRKVATGTDDKMQALQGAISAAMEAGGGWLTLNEIDEAKGATVAWVGQGVSVVIEYDMPQRGEVGIVQADSGPHVY